MADVPDHFTKLVPPGFKLGTQETLDTCPYNRSHYYLAHKGKAHVDRCRKAYMKKYNTPEQHVELFGCRYSDAHLVPYIEIPWHQERCPFKNQPQRQKYELFVSEKPEPQPKSNSMGLNDLTVSELKLMLMDIRWGGGEDWRVESRLFEKTHFPFNPAKSIISTGAPWCPPGLNKTERKEFRIAHREVAKMDRGGTFLAPVVADWSVPKSAASRHGVRSFLS